MYIRCWWRCYISCPVLVPSVPCPHTMSSKPHLRLHLLQSVCRASPRVSCVCGSVLVDCIYSYIQANWTCSLQSSAVHWGDNIIRILADNPIHIYLPRIYWLTDWLAGCSNRNNNTTNYNTVLWRVIRITHTAIIILLDGWIVVGWLENILDRQTFICKTGKYTRRDTFIKYERVKKAPHSPQVYQT